MFVHPDLRIVFVQHRIAERDDRCQHVVQTVTGRQCEARRIVFGDPPHVRAGQAVGLLLGHQRRRVLNDHAGLVLDGVAVLVGEHHRHAHVAVGFLQRRQQLTAVPSDGLVVVAETRVHDSVRAVAAELGVVESVGVPGDHVLHGLELAVERLAVRTFPEFFDVADRLTAQFVHIAVVGAQHHPGRSCVGRIADPWARRWRASPRR